MPRVPGGRDTITQPFYDSGAIATATTKLVFFQTPYGAGTSVWSTGAKTLEDTNMPLAGQLPSPWTFVIRTVQFQLSPDAGFADAAKILKGGALELIIGAKSWLQIPIVLLPGGHAGLYGALGTMTAAATNAFASNGMPDARNVFALSQPIELLENENFQATVTWGTAPAPSATVNCRLIFNGELTRGVQ